MTRKKSGTYSPVSFVAVEQIAKTFKTPSHVVAYLTIARHADMQKRGEFGENRVSCAGAKKIATICSIGQLKATSRLNDLANHGFLQKAPEGLKINGQKATWIIPASHEFDTQLPHQLFDAFVDVQSEAIPIARLFQDENKKGEVILTALVMLIYFYKVHNLLDHGGIPAGIFHRDFEEASALDADGLYRWECIPSKHGTTTWEFALLILSASGQDTAKYTTEQRNEAVQTWFWPAHTLLTKAGFLFETVMLYQQGQPFMPLRINDYHENLKMDNWLGGYESNGLGFYVNPLSSNPAFIGEQERMWVKLTSEDPLSTSYTKPGSRKIKHREFEIFFQSWLRFRCSDPDTGRAIEKFKKNYMFLSTQITQIVISQESSDI